MPTRPSLSYPWWRTELLEHLERMSDQLWLVGASHPGRSYDELDQALDFFDDTGLVDSPEGLVGFVLFDDLEVEAMRNFGTRLDAALGQEARAAWRSVAGAARDALAVLRRNDPDAPP